MDLAPAALEGTWSQHGIDNFKALQNKRSVDLMGCGDEPAEVDTTCDGPASKRPMIGYGDVAVTGAGGTSNVHSMPGNINAVQITGVRLPSQPGVEAPCLSPPFPPMGSTGLASMQPTREATQPSMEGKQCWEPQLMIPAAVDSPHRVSGSITNSINKAAESSHPSSVLYPQSQVQQNPCWSPISCGMGPQSGDVYDSNVCAVAQAPGLNTTGSCSSEFGAQHHTIESVQVNSVEDQLDKSMPQTASHVHHNMSPMVVGSSPWGNASQSLQPTPDCTSLARVIGGNAQPAGVICTPTSGVSPGHIEAAQWSLANPSTAPQPWPQYILPTLPLRPPMDCRWYRQPTDPHLAGPPGHAVDRSHTPGRLSNGKQGVSLRKTGPNKPVVGPGPSSANSTTSPPQPTTKPKSTVNRKPYRCGRCGQRKNQHMCPFKHIMISIRTFGVQTVPPDPSFFDPRDPPTWPSPNDGYPTIVPRPYVAVLDNHDESTGRYNMEYCQVSEAQSVENGVRANNAKPFEVPAAGSRRPHESISGKERANLSMAAWYGAEVGFASSLGRWPCPAPRAGLGGQPLGGGQSNILDKGGERANPAPGSNVYPQQQLVSKSENSAPSRTSWSDMSLVQVDRWRDDSQVKREQELQAETEVKTDAPATTMKADLDQRLENLERIMCADRKPQGHESEEWSAVTGVEGLTESAQVFMGCDGSEDVGATGVLPAGSISDAAENSPQQRSPKESITTDLPQSKPSTDAAGEKVL